MALFRVVASWFLNPFIENRKAQAWAVGYAEGYIQGRAEAQAEWRAWKLRLIAAEAQGVPFDEPSPGECRYWRPIMRLNGAGIAHRISSVIPILAGIHSLQETVL